MLSVSFKLMIRNLQPVCWYDDLFIDIPIRSSYVYISFACLTYACPLDEKENLPSYLKLFEDL